MRCSAINEEIRKIEAVAIEVMEDCIKNKKNGIPIPDVMSLSLNIEPDSVDTAVLYIHSDEFKTINEERRENHGNNEF